MAIKTITVRGEGVMQEGIATNAITPGHLLERTSTADELQVHSVSGGVHGAIIAVEDELQGNEIDDAYANNARIFFKIFRKGDVFNGIIANGEAIAIGDYVVSNGNGEMKEIVGDSSGTIVEEHAVGVALDAVDMSDSSAADPASARCRIEVV